MLFPDVDVGTLQNLVALKHAKEFAFVEIEVLMAHRLQFHFLQGKTCPVLNTLSLEDVCPAAIVQLFELIVLEFRIAFINLQFLINGLLDLILRAWTIIIVF